MGSAHPALLAEGRFEIARQMLADTALEVARHAGLEQRLGRERLLFNARAAIERYQAL